MLKYFRWVSIRSGGNQEVEVEPLVFLSQREADLKSCDWSQERRSQIVDCSLVNGRANVATAQLLDAASVHALNLCTWGGRRGGRRGDSDTR